MGSAQDDRGLPCQVAPFGYPRINACLAAPRGLSQLTTPFIASRRQGIHRAPYLTCPLNLRESSKSPYHKTLSSYLGISYSVVKELETLLNLTKQRDISLTPNPTKHHPTRTWWRMPGSNRRPLACKASALPAELIPQKNRAYGSFGGPRWI